MGRSPSTPTPFPSGPGLPTRPTHFPFKRGYDLALTDIVLGTQDGHEIAETLVAIQPGLRVVFMSGYGAPRYGADLSDPMLAKPFDAAELVERVERALAD